MEQESVADEYEYEDSCSMILWYEFIFSTKRMHSVLTVTKLTNLVCFEMKLIS